MNAQYWDYRGWVNGIQHLAGGLPVNTGSDSKHLNSLSEINSFLCRAIKSTMLQHWPQGPRPICDQGMLLLWDCQALSAFLLLQPVYHRAQPPRSRGLEHGEHLGAHVGEHLKYLSIILLCLISWLSVSAGDPMLSKSRQRDCSFSPFKAAMSAPGNAKVAAAPWKAALSSLTAAS